MTIDIENLDTETAEALVSPSLLDGELQKRLECKLVDLMASGLSGFEHGCDDLADRLPAWVSEFYALYPSRVVRDNSGGSGFNDSLWLFVLARLFDPEIIVESGVHKGHSSWIFRQACPNVRLFCFDITLKKLIHLDENAEYFEKDWMEEDLNDLLENYDKALIFFDDHINHARRIREAKARGFRWALFDDNLPAEAIYATGGPPLPTLAMMMDPSLQPGCELAWTRKGKAYKYRYKAEDVQGAIEVIETYTMLPDLAQVNHYSLGSGLSVVKLKR